MRAHLIIPPVPPTRVRMGVRGDVMRQSPYMLLTDGACDTVPFCADFGPYNLGTTFHVVSILKSLFKHPDQRLSVFGERKGGRKHTLRFSSFAGHQFCEPMRCGNTKEHVLIVMKCARARKLLSCEPSSCSRRWSRSDAMLVKVVRCWCVRLRTRE